MSNRRKTDYSPHVPSEKAPPCSVAGCDQPGGYKAPKSRQSINDYQWFCLDHVREHNAKWDYFQGLGAEEIEQFMKDSVTGHRPTWTREGHVRDRYAKLQDALYHFMQFGTAKPAPKAMPPLSSKLRKALTLFELEYPYSEKELKRQYRLLVKQYHPDLHPEDKDSEERFKQVTLAYALLSEHLGRA